MLLAGRTDWIVRRKETVQLLSESSLRHCLSLDFEVDELPRAQVDDVEYRYVPLTLLRKEPGSFTRFDFEDESGRTLPLPSRADNAELSGLVLVAAARRLIDSDPNLERSATLEAELKRIAGAEKDRAMALVHEAYRSPRCEFAADEDAGLRLRLWGDSNFEWLLRTLASSSLMVIRLRCDGRDRRILKLRYDEKTEDTTRLRRKRLLAWFGALGYRLGWRGYLQSVVSPFTGARTYHFEFHVPEGMELLEAGMTKGEPDHDDRHRAHLYDDEAGKARTSAVYAQLRIRGAGFGSAAFLTSLLIVLSLVVAHCKAADLANTTTSAPALLLLFPGLIASYFARPTHPLVGRLLELARVALLVSAALAYVAAGRLALISTQHPANPQTLDDFFGVLAAIGIVTTMMLLATWMLPLRLSGRLRRGLRWLGGREAATGGQG